MGTRLNDVGERIGRARHATAKRARNAAHEGRGAVSRTRKRVGFWIAGERPPSRARRIGSVAVAGAAGAAVAFFLDPASGKRRRHVARDRTAAAVGKVISRTGRRARWMKVRLRGVVEERRDSGAMPESDAVLEQKVRSEVLGGLDLPERINVNAEGGRVVLRGEVPSPGRIRHIEDEVLAVDGVVEVENLLHVPGTTAPHAVSG